MVIQIHSVKIILLGLIISTSLSSCKRTNTSGNTKASSTDGDATTEALNDKKAHKVSHKTVVSANIPVSFNEHIQPILSANCYHCHGPDSGTRLPEDEPYRLDSAEGAFEVRKNGKANIIKGDPDNSLLIELMESKDPDMVMPLHPTKSPHGKIMDPADIALVRRWVKEGAIFEDHWAYLSPKKVAPPEVANKAWLRNPIDNFILAKLEPKGLEPNKDEDKGRLLRRLTFDLTGLPPTPEELDSFINDSRDFELVYAETVNALLKTDAYAEHFARHWLDVARYADTHGIHIDNYRSIWPYRDWVIEAFRKNMKFDQFTQEQIAGDMMPNATLEQKVASGFHRCLPTTGEGGAIAEEYNAVYAQDRVDTTTAAWLGLTAGCAACHDHKFDAISTKENYQLTAFFRNTTMSALDRNNGHHPPNILVPLPADREKLTQVTAQSGQLNSQLKAHRTKNESSFKAWMQSQKGQQAETGQPISGLIVELPLNDKTKGVNHPTFTSKAPLAWATGPAGDAVKFIGGNEINLGNTGDFERNQAFSYGAWIKAPQKLSAGIISKMNTQKSHRGYDLWVEQGKLAVHLIHSWPQNFVKVTTKAAFPKDQWFHVMVTYDGSSKPEGIKIYVNGKSMPHNTLESKLTETIKTDAPFLLGSRYGNQPFHNGQMQFFQLYNKALTSQEVINISAGRKINELINLAKHNPKQLNQLRDYYFTNVDKAAIALQGSINKNEAEKAAIQKRGVITLIMEERANKKPTAHVLIRGEYAVKDKEVLSPNTPASLPPMTKEMPKNRLGLAMWLTDPKNPLPARVTVNRYWYYFFGSGIVSSNSDFGVMGARPTHPKLLDWLAVDFVEKDWDLQELIKNIVMSSTYRQSAVISEKKMEIDPLNLYYARAPRYRLEAEQIRDLALKASNLLHDQIGGPSVKPYSPSNIWSSVAMKSSNTKKYVPDKGSKLYRRSLYTFIKRTAIHPTMEILNAPSREVSCVQRELTNTPLQAFVIMNDPQFVEASRQLAAIAMQQGSDTKQRVNTISQRLLSRNMEEDEIAIIEKTLKNIQAKFKAKPAEAAKLIGVGESKPPAGLDPIELASWTIIANQVLNMDETLNK